MSRVLNDRPGVSEATRQAVLTAIDVLGYDRPTRLSQRRAGRAGHARAGQPDLPGVRAGHRDRAGRQGFTPVLCTQTPGGVHEDDYVQMLLDRGVSGIIFLSGQHADAPPTRAATACATAACRSCWSTAGCDGVDAPFVSNDDVAPMDLRSTTSCSSATRDRARARARALHAGDPQAAGFPCGDARAPRRRRPRRLVTHTVFSLEGGAAAAGRLIDAGRTAVICGSDLMALGAIRGARRWACACPTTLGGRLRRLDDHGLHRPAADDDPPGGRGDGRCRGAGPARRDRRRGPAPRAEYVFRPELVVRGSTGAVPLSLTSATAQDSPVACSRSSRSCSSVSTTSATESTRYAACVVPPPTFTGTSPSSESNALKASSSVTSSPL